MRSRPLPWLLLLLASLVPAAASAQITIDCNSPSARDSVAREVENGTPITCAVPIADPEKSFDEIQSEALATKSVTVFNTFFEQLNGCGYHPQAEMVSCDVEIKQTGGYGAFPGGTNEHVTFCFDCDNNGIFEYITWGNVHVTNNNFATNPAPTPSWYMEAHATTFQNTNCLANTGAQARARAILSWAARWNNCTPTAASRPVWGNMIDFTIRRDP